MHSKEAKETRFLVIHARLRARETEGLTELHTQRAQTLEGRPREEARSDAGAAQLSAAPAPVPVAGPRTPALDD